MPHSIAISVSLIIAFNRLAGELLAPTMVHYRYLVHGHFPGRIRVTDQSPAFGTRKNFDYVATFSIKLRPVRFADYKSHEYSLISEAARSLVWHRY